MCVPEILQMLIGRWKGINRLHTVWLPENPMRETASQATIENTARGRFLKIEYDWFYEEKPQDGLMLIGSDDQTGLIKTFWIDSWHLGDKFMVSEGDYEDGKINVKGFYTVPDQPDWGWRTVFEAKDDKTLNITMYNVSPENEETLAVEMEFERE